MVVASKRFGPREWFVIHSADAEPETLANERLHELHAPLVVPIVVIAANVEERDRIVHDLTRYIDAVQGAARRVETDVIEIGELRVDRNAHRVNVGDAEIVLTSLEFRLLLTLMDRREHVQTRRALLLEVWGISASNRTRTVDTHVKRLRDKLRSAGRFVQSVRGVGYRFSETPAPYGGGEDRDSTSRLSGQPGRIKIASTS
jgi:two-component system phosphate regulon response regulator PhoB